jgi:tRNA pseudouridine38-40 synthase
LTVAYDGTDFHGFQTQRPGLRTVQVELEQAVFAVTGEAAKINGAGRTDAGVHARGQVVNFRTRSPIPVERWPLALGSRLPPDVVVQDAAEVGLDFHARYLAVGKIYRYMIYESAVPSPFWDRYALRWPGSALDADAMRHAAGILQGYHDFQAFHDSGSRVRDTRRHLFHAGLHQFMEDDLWAVVHPSPLTGKISPLPGRTRFLGITLIADGFLYHMARVVAGTLLEVGASRLAPDSLRERMADGKRHLTGPTAPARGLCLERVIYCQADLLSLLSRV